MPHKADDGIPTGAPAGVMDPVAAAECNAAQEKRYAECIAQGMSERSARFEAIGAAAEKRREQVGLPAKPPPDFYVPPAQRLRFDAQGRLIPPKKTRR
jgi:hypothetical protein